MADPRPLTRDQLAKFLPDAEAIKRFERLFTVAGDLTPADVATLFRLTQEVTIETGTASASAQSALDQLTQIVQDAAVNIGAADDKASAALGALSSIAQSLEMLALAPVAQGFVSPNDNIQPPLKADNFVKTDYIDVDTLPPEPSHAVGRLWWNNNGTLNIGMGNGNITQQVGEEFFSYGKASAAISDTNLQLVYKTGTVGASGAITFAPAVAGITDADRFVGVATEAIALNAFGRVTTMGVVRGINTTGSVYGEVWADNDDIWYNPVTGGLTKTRPITASLEVQIGTIISAGSGGSGSFSVKITDASIYNVAIETHAATSKVTPVDADELPLSDSASAFSLKKLTWANLKATLATWIGGNLIAGSFTSLVSSTTGKVASTLGVGNATPAASGAGITFPASESLSSDVNTLDHYVEGSYTATATGMTTSPTGTVTFTVVGNMVTIDIPVIEGTSNSGAFSLTGMPAIARPANGKQGLCYVKDAGVLSQGSLYVNYLGTIEVYKSAGGFAAAGTKGISYISFTYTKS